MVDNLTLNKEILNSFLKENIVTAFQGQRAQYFVYPSMMQDARGRCH